MSMSPPKRHRSNESLKQLFWVTEPEAIDTHPFSAILDALAASDPAEASRLLQAQELDVVSISPVGMPPMTPPLIQAAWQGDSRLVDQLMSRALERSLNLTDIHDVGFGGNVLHWAAAAGHDSLLESLLQRAGPTAVHQRSFEGFTPLHAAACHGHSTCVRLLLQHKADPNAVDDRLSAPLHEAAQWGHSLAAKELLSSRANPEGRNSVGETPLLLAARGGYTDIMQLLMDSGATIDSRNAAGVTPLLSAAFFGHEPAVRMLHSRGAQLRAVDSSRGRSAIEWAAFNNHRKIVEALIQDQRDMVSAARLLATETGAEDVLACLESL